MIRKQEILGLRGEWGLNAEVIEKDYVLGWTLAAIASQARLRDTWLFKGGTALKKCHFETYRFSEDLDFTVVENGPLAAEDVTALVGELAEYLYDHAGIEVHVDRCRCRPRRNKRGKPTCEVSFHCSGPLRMPTPQRIKFDLTADELVVLPPERRTILHPFSDPFPDVQILTYALTELFAEKLRALAQRCRPRDLYDVVRLHQHSELGPRAEEVRRVLEAKCDFVGIAVPTHASVTASPAAESLEAEWANMLAHQLPALPDPAQFWRGLEAVFEWLEGARRAPALASAKLSKERVTSWRPPRGMRRWGAAFPLELLRFAGANRLKVELDYRARTGRQGWRKVEPYSLRRSDTGALLLYVVNDHGQLRSYRVDCILGARVTNEPFEPRYLVEF